MSLVIAMDIGGTFTDLVAFDLASGAIHQAKSSTTPYDLSEGIQRTLTKSGLPIPSVDSFIHGSTVAINTAIERSGAKTALVTTEGMRDVYKIGRGNRPDAYHFHFKRPTPFVPRHRTFELVERLNAAGEVLVEFDEGRARDVAKSLAEAGVEAIAVCLIHAWSNPEHEMAAGAALRAENPDAFCSLSHEILREYREYERTSTTVLNAYVGPKVSHYLQDLVDLLKDEGFKGQLLIMQSNGGSMSPETAKRIPVATMESGPVGGIIAAAEVTKELGYSNIIAFDMGGTTAKVSLVQESRPAIAPGYWVGGTSEGHPVMYPVVDIVEVGAGGGSIAWIDEVGALKVGPRSAGGHPGPVCYGQGGTEPTVTDANVALGRLGSGRFLGGEMGLDVEAAREAIRTKIAEPLGMTVNEAALGILRIAVAEMSLAVRSVSVARGHDPRDYAMVAFGGAGPLHAGEIARELHIPTLIIPRLPGHFSALGMLLADLRHDYVQTYYKPLAKSDFGEIEAMFTAMEESAASLLAEEGMTPEQMSFSRFLDMRYEGQEFPMQIPVEPEQIRSADREALRAAFNAHHDRAYGHQGVNEGVEVINLRLAAFGYRKRSRFPDIATTGETAEIERRDIVLDDPNNPVSCAVYERANLHAGQVIEGPASISEYASTTLLHKGDVLTVAASGELIVALSKNPWETRS